MPQESSSLPAVSLISIACFAGAVLVQAVRSIHWGQGSWNITEWLINYSGGFVRRGLPGEVISILSTASGIPANILAIILSLVLYSMLLFFFLRKAKDQFPLPLILSAVLLGAPAYTDEIVRKDALSILFLVLCLLVSVSKANSLTKLLIVNSVACVAILSHEQFFFLGVPALLVFNISSWDSRPIFMQRSLPVSFLALLPSMAAFAVASRFHGNTSVARAIDSSWRPLWVSIHSANCCSDEPQAAIDGLQWTLPHALSLPAHVLGEFSFGIWAPLAWLITIALCFFFLVQFLGADTSGNVLPKIDPLEKTRLGGILLFQLIAVSPLFIVGWDFGRWIFLWTTSSLTIFFFRLDSDLQIFQIFRKIAARLINSKLLMQVHPRPWYLLVFGVPSCSWSLLRVADSSPIGYYVVKACHVIQTAHRW